MKKTNQRKLIVRVDFMSRRIVTDTEEHLIMKKGHSARKIK